MKTFVLLVLLGTLFLSAPVRAQTSDGVEPLAYVRIYADSTGASHFEDVELPMALVEPGRGIPPTPASAPGAASGVLSFCPPAGASAGWHPSPRRQYNVVLSGTVVVEVSDGEMRRFGPGSLLLLEDTEGQGHQTRVEGEERACFVSVALSEP